MLLDFDHLFSVSQLQRQVSEQLESLRLVLLPWLSFLPQWVCLQMTSHLLQPSTGSCKYNTLKYYSIYTTTKVTQSQFHASIFIRDRFRTMINVLGDALAAGIMAHLCRKDFQKDVPSSSNPERVRYIHHVLIHISIFLIRK